MLKKSQMSCSHPDDTFFLSSLVSGLFSPRLNSQWHNLSVDTYFQLTKGEVIGRKFLSSSKCFPTIIAQ